MKKLIAVCLIIIFAVSSLAACGNDNDSALTEVTFVLDWTPNTNHVGVYVADELGYFAEEGIKVKIAQPPEDSSVVLVASGKADISISFQDSLAAAFGGGETLPVTAIGAVLQHNTSGIISRKGEGMDTPSGLEGHSYSTWNGAIELAVLRNVVEADNGDFDKVQLIPSTVTDEVSALKSGQTDSIWVYYGWGGIKTEISGLETDYFAFSDIDEVFDYYTPVIIAGDKFLSEHPEEARAFMRAAARGYEYAAKNPEQAAELLVEAVPELDITLVKESLIYLSDKYTDEGVKWGYIDAERWNAFYSWVNENKLTEGEIPMDCGFSNEFLPD